MRQISSIVASQPLLFFLIVISLSSYLTVSGCALAPVIGAVSDLGVTQADRARILSKSLRDYHDTLQIGDLNYARHFTSPELSPKLDRIYAGIGDNIRITSYRAVNTTFNDELGTADVKVILKSYDISRLTLRDREEVETWKFHTGGSWQLIDIKPGKIS